LLLRDGRVAQLIDHSDHLWTRILDVPAALSARRYQARGEIVLQVEDEMGFAGGRFLLDVSPEVVVDGGTGQAAHPASCVPTEADPDLTVSVGSLATAYLGGI
jgi:predicted acetyltransferase